MARGDCHVYNDATLISYYPFDSTTTSNDYSVYLSNGIASGTTTVSAGRVNQALSFSSNTAYFQSQSFASTRILSSAFTVSFWIYPTITPTGGSLVHLSSSANGGGTCYDLLVFAPSGNLVVQYMTDWGSTMFSFQGPSVSINVWTHITVMYAQSNSILLYLNGVLAAASTQTSGINYHDFVTPMYITLGNFNPAGPTAPFSCSNGSIPIASGPYRGWIDEFRLYNRALTMQELCVLANP